MIINVENKDLATIVAIVKQQIAVYDDVMFNPATTEEDMVRINSRMKYILSFFRECGKNIEPPSSKEVASAMYASGIEHRLNGDCEVYDDGFLDGVRWMHQRLNISPDQAI